MVVYLIGVAVWAGATAALRLYNIAFFGGSVALQVLVYAVAAAVIFWLVGFVSRLLAIPLFRCAAGLALPGMALDIAVIHYWSHVFPNLPDAPGAFGALMLWCYGMAFAAAAVLDRRAGAKAA